MLVTTTVACAPAAITLVGVIVAVTTCAIVGMIEAFTWLGAVLLTVFVAVTPGRGVTVAILVDVTVGRTVARIVGDFVGDAVAVTVFVRPADEPTGARCVALRVRVGTRVDVRVGGGNVAK